MTLTAAPRIPYDLTKGDWLIGDEPSSTAHPSRSIWSKLTSPRRGRPLSFISPAPPLPVPTIPPISQSRPAVLFVSVQHPPDPSPAPAALSPNRYPSPSYQSRIVTSNASTQPAANTHPSRDPFLPSAFPTNHNAIASDRPNHTHVVSVIEPKPVSFQTDGASLGETLTQLSAAHQAGLIDEDVHRLLRASTFAKFSVSAAGPSSTFRIGARAADSDGLRQQHVPELPSSIDHSHLRPPLIGKRASTVGSDDTYLMVDAPPTDDVGVPASPSAPQPTVRRAASVLRQPSISKISMRSTATVSSVVNRLFKRSQSDRPSKSHPQLRSSAPSQSQTSPRPASYIDQTGGRSPSLALDSNGDLSSPTMGNGNKRPHNESQLTVLRAQIKAVEAERETVLQSLVDASRLSSGSLHRPTHHKDLQRKKQEIEIAFHDRLELLNEQLRCAMIKDRVASGK